MAVVGLIGVLLVAKPDQGMFNALSVIGLGACFLSAMAFVTVRALTSTEPPERIVFYFVFLARSFHLFQCFGTGVLSHLKNWPY